jgi:hypothetical protein
MDQGCTHYPAYRRVQFNKTKASFYVVSSIDIWNVCMYVCYMFVCMYVNDETRTIELRVSVHLTRPIGLLTLK